MSFHSFSVYRPHFTLLNPFMWWWQQWKYHCFEWFHNNEWTIIVASEWDPLWFHGWLGRFFFFLTACSLKASLRITWIFHFILWWVLKGEITERRNHYIIMSRDRPRQDEIIPTCYWSHIGINKINTSKLSDQEGMIHV